MIRTLTLSVVVALLASAVAEAAEPPPLPSANPRRGGKVVHSIIVPVLLTHVHAKVKSAEIVCGVWKNKALAEKFEEKNRLGVGTAKVPLDPGPEGQFYVGPGLSVNIFAESGKGGLRRGQTWACSLSFELEDGTVEAPGDAKSSKPSALVAGGGPDAAFRPKMFGVL